MLYRTDVPMSHFSRTAFLLACITPAGLSLVGCGQPAAPAARPAITPVRPVATSLPPIREPRLIAVPSDVRPVAGEWLDSSHDGGLRYSERHLQGSGSETPQRIAAPTEPSPLGAPSGQPEVSEDVRRRLIVRQPAAPTASPAPRQAGPYSEQLPESPTPVLAPQAPFAAAAPSPPPTFRSPALAPVQETQPPPFRQAPLQVSTPAPTMGPLRDRSGFRAVQERVAAMNQQAISLAQRGALFAAREDLIQALRLAAQSLDAADGTNGYSLALDQGLTALDEANDFALHASSTAPIQIDQIVIGHRTPVLQDQRDQQLSPVIAMQQYYGFAGERLTAAAGELPAAAETLFWLGKVHTALARQSTQADRLHGPQAMVCYRAALTTSPQHYLAANELGVLLARYGQLQDAKRLLQQSVNARSHAEGWQNLVIVHRRLAEPDLARLAEQELIALTGKPAPAAPTSGRPPVQWVEPKAFAAAGQPDSWEGSASPVASQPRGTSTRR
jgi:tetratricopeptide (TPR) repeat protein